MIDQISNFRTNFATETLRQLHAGFNLRRERRNDDFRFLFFDAFDFFHDSFLSLTTDCKLRQNFCAAVHGDFPLCFFQRRLQMLVRARLGEAEQIPQLLLREGPAKIQK